MRILFIGGTGIISTACTHLAIARGHEVTLCNRSRHAQIPGTSQVTVDINDPVDSERLLSRLNWDVVVDFLVFTPEELERRISLFRGRTAQYVFISSASAYQKPLSHHLITESTPLANPHWDYSRNKIACEERLLRALREEAYPMTIVRPSFTFGDTVFPLAVNSWLKSYTAIDRMRRGLPVIVPGDGLSLWTMTHNTDFAKGLVGLCGHRGAIGQTFHITSDEVLTWDQIYLQTAEAAGVSNPKLVHIATDFLGACDPGLACGLIGDKSHSAIFDNTKIKRFVPDYVATTRYRDGIAKTVAWYDADSARRQIDDEANQTWDRILAAYDQGLKAAAAAFPRKN